VLETDNLCAYYEAVQALEGISLNVRKGEIVTIIGANGAGKSTLLACIAGLRSQVRGRILFCGNEITRLDPANVVRRGISLVPEGRQLFPSMSVEDNISMGAYVRRLRKRELAGEVDRVCRLFPILKERRKQLAGTLSGGEQQMVAIARGLVSGPMLLLLDEPSIGLAPRIVELIFKVILELRKEGVTILLVEQNARAALSLADRGYVLVTGRVQLTDSAKSLLDNQSVRACYLGA
jgi:branched-chain amino acid transport system ATP-binding protein